MKLWVSISHRTAALEGYPRPKNNESSLYHAYHFVRIYKESGKFEKLLCYRTD